MLEKERSNQANYENGIIYCVTGNKLFLEELRISIKSLQKFNKNISISLFTEDKFLTEINDNKFKSIHLIEKPDYSFSDKIFSLRNTPYKKTLYLDCDTVIWDDISELFILLDKFEIVLAYIPFKNRRINSTKPPKFNGGVIGFRNTKNTKKMLETWDKNYKISKDYDDQVTLRDTILSSSVTYFVLPSEYNFRTPFSCYARKKIKIFHGHNLMDLEPSKLESIINYINKSNEERVWFPGRGVLILQEEVNLLTKLLFFIEKNFFQNILQRFWNSSLLRKLKNKLWQYYFPWLINWVIPTQHREGMKFSHKQIMKYGKS